MAQYSRGVTEGDAATDVISTLPRVWRDGTTRCLAHAVHLNEHLREYVLDTIVDHHVQAVCPSYGVDVLAVARHAVVARDRRHRQAFLITWLRRALLLAAAIGLIATLRVWLRGETMLPDLTPLLLAVLAAIPLTAAIWWVLFWCARQERLDALALVQPEAPPARDQAPPLGDAGLERRLDQLPAGNVVVYAGGEGDPFVGSGRRLQRRNLSPIDITRPADEGGKVAAFDARDLHRYLQQQIPALGFDGLKPSSRLYVHGDYAKHVPGLLPHPQGPPEPLVAPEVLDSCVANPTERARTYVCMERILSGGDLVITLYVRVRLEQNLLSVEWAIYVLPPLRKRYLPSRSFVAGGRRGAIRKAMREATGELLSSLFGPLGGITAERRKRRRKRHAQVAKEIRRGFEHDYGANGGLREAVASYDTTKHFDVTDVTDSAMRLQRRLMDCVESFLDERGVDTSEFKDQVKNINTTNVTYEIGSVSGDTNVIGSHAQVNQSSGGGEG